MSSYFLSLLAIVADNPESLRSVDIPRLHTECVEQDLSWQLFIEWLVESNKLQERTLVAINEFNPFPHAQPETLTDNTLPF